MSSETIPAFSRPFLPELQAEFLSYLRIPDLKSSSLAFRALHEEAYPLLRRSIKFQLGAELNPEIDPHLHFRRFISFLSGLGRGAIYIRALTLILPGRHGHSHPTEPSQFLSVPLSDVEKAFSSLRNLLLLRIVAAGLPEQMISVLSRAFAPRTAISLGIGRPLFPLYQSYASSLTELIVSTPLTNDMNFPSLPHLRFVASSNPLIISGFVRSSPVEAIYLWGGDVSSESVLEFELGDALQVRTAEGISSLRSARLCFDVGDDTELGDVICALACPTLEELHLSINCCTWHITAPYLMDEYPVVSLERPELADLFPRVKSIRFQMYDDTRNQGCSTRGHEVPQIPSVEFASLSPLEATRRLAHWLDTDPLPSLERVEIQCLGHGVEQEYCIVDIEASRLPSSGTSDGRWTVTDSRVERRLQEGAACVTAADQPQWSDYISLKHGNQSSNWWEAIEYRSPIYWSAPTSAWMRSSL